MNIAQLHLILTHFPIVGFIASFALLIYAQWRRSAEVRTIALVGIALSGLIILPVLATGDASGELVEHLPGVREALVERHEDAAGSAGVLAVLAAGAALLTLLAQRYWPRLRSAGLLAVTGLVLAATVGIGWTSHLGGQIRHPELALAWNATGDGGYGAPEAGEGEGRRWGLPGLGGTAQRDDDGRGGSGDDDGDDGDDGDSRKGGRDRD